MQVSPFLVLDEFKIPFYPMTKVEEAFGIMAILG